MPAIEGSTFHAADYAVLAITLTVSMTIGVYYAYKGRKSYSAKEYFTASGTMGIIPTTFSLLASVICSIWYIGFPAEVYEYGFHFAWDFIMLPIAMAIVACGFVPVFYELGVTSANEYLEKRFNKSIRMVGSVMYIVNSGLYVALVTYIPALSVSQVTGIHLWVSLVLMSLIGTTYTALGGIRAVMWTDVFQMLIIYASMIAVVVKGTIDVGGAKVVFERAIEGHRFALPPLTADPRYRYNIGTVILMCCLYWIGLYGTYQTQVQRYLSCPSKKSAQRTVWYNLLAFFTLEYLIVYMSLMLYANFQKCDPKLNNEISTYDELLTFFVTKTFRNYPGLPGLFVSGVFSGALSTVSSCLNSMAAVTMEDFVLAVPRMQSMTDRTRTTVSRWIALFYGLLTIGMMAVIEKLGTVITFWGYNNGTIMGCNAGLFALGLFIPWANSIGAIIALAVTGILGLIIAIGAQVLDVSFQSEPMSVEGCNATNLSNITSLGNVSFISNHSTLENTPVLYSILENREGFRELFTVSPHALQPLTMIMVIVLGAIISWICKPKSQTTVHTSLLSPMIRPFLKMYQRKISTNKFISVKTNEPFDLNHKEDHESFINGTH